MYNKLNEKQRKCIDRMLEELNLIKDEIEFKIFDKSKFPYLMMIEPTGFLINTGIKLEDIGGLN